MSVQKEINGSSVVFGQPGDNDPDPPELVSAASKSEASSDLLYHRIWCAYAFRFFKLQVQDLQAESPDCRLVFEVSTYVPVDLASFNTVAQLVAPGFPSLGGHCLFINFGRGRAEGGGCNSEELL